MFPDWHVHITKKVVNLEYRTFYGVRLLVEIHSMSRQHSLTSPCMAAHGSSRFNL